MSRRRDAGCLDRGHARRVAPFDGRGARGYLRPVRIAQIKALFDLSQGAHYWLVYRGFHALLIILCVIILCTKVL